MTYAIVCIFYDLHHIIKYCVVMTCYNCASYRNQHPNLRYDYIDPFSLSSYTLFHLNLFLNLASLMFIEHIINEDHIMVYINAHATFAKYVISTLKFSTA